MKQKSKLKNIAFRGACVLFVLVMLSYCLLSGLLAKYSSYATIADAVNVAAFSVEAGGEYSSADITFGDLAPNETKSYAFTIKSESDVKVRCFLSVETTGNLPLVYSVSEEGKVGSVAVATDGTYTQIITIAPNGSEATLFLNAKWQGSNDASLLGEIDAVRLHITAEQVD